MWYQIHDMYEIDEIGSKIPMYEVTCDYIAIDSIRGRYEIQLPQNAWLEIYALPHPVYSVDPHGERRWFLTNRQNRYLNKVIQYLRTTGSKMTIPLERLEKIVRTRQYNDEDREKISRYRYLMQTKHGFR